MMNGSRAIKALLIAVAVMAPADFGYGAPKPLVSMITGSVTSQPIGHYEFCKANPANVPCRQP
ncbi:transglutaminase family protein cysteine peptidase BTLCP, partial [Rhizobium sp. PDO1-076]